MGTFAGMLRTALTLVAWLVGLTIAAFLVVVFSGTREVRYKCTGQLGAPEESTRGDVYLKLQLYRSWMFWTKEDGSAYTEVPNGNLEYYSSLNVTGDFVHFTTSEFDRSGNLSTLSNHLSLGGHGIMFDGECKRIERDD